jgi:hypothetical protein
MLNKELINHNNKLYWVYRKVKQSHVNENFINDIKEMWNCDLVLRSKLEEDFMLFFMREIEELEMIT